MFLSIEELVDQAKAYPSVAELMIAVEMEMSGRSRSHIIEIMEKPLSNGTINQRGKRRCYLRHRNYRW